ncbi:MAG: AAA family ATPase, partial [Caldilineaceae bacterium]|nr:AAA family ATPase [Caldilineaceae bacterium]
KREWLRRELLQALNTLVQHHEAAQRWTDAYHFAWRSVEIDPLREVAHQQVMRALAQRGQRKAALDQYATLCRLLHDELGAKPATTTTALFEAIREHALAAGDVRSAGTQTVGAKPTIPHNLPIQHTPFVGRQQELWQIAARLSQPECHLLTLVGPGGVGKSRLALEAANHQLQTHADAYPDGIHFIPLATVEDNEQLLSAFATALDFPFPDDLLVQAERQAALVAHLQTKQALLLLDNYEQLTDFTDLIVALLTAAPHLRLLITSRVPLHLHAEWLLDIGGLSYPTAADWTAAPWAASTMPWTGESRSPVAFEAVQLFISAAQRVLPDFTLTDQVAPAVARLCFLTQGLPLAIELAAAQVRNVPLAALAEAVQRNLDALATTMRDVPLRHRSLRAVFDHSWMLLTPALQQLFRRLAVFRGSFTAEAAQIVTGCTPTLFGALVANAFVREVPEHSMTPRDLLRERGSRYLL